ncbi:glycine receptor subunit alpha-2-like [Liolophura sinensis]|uniref:glycine receptor subunit alpha-2-like n=1 Tax=Liolophura sinensis TaxID=3198878 RepID=UPI003158D339
MSKRWMWVLLFISVCAVYIDDVIGSVMASNSTRKETIHALLVDYDSTELPNDITGTPTMVGVQIYVCSIDSFDEAAMDFTITIFLRQLWRDHRLSYESNTVLPEPLELDVKLIDRVWVPDLFFVNEKSARFHMVTVSNRLLHIYRNGTVFYSLRLSLRLSCQMNLEKYPLDAQVCPIIVESYGHSTEYLQFAWMGNPPVITDMVVISQFRLDGLTVEDCSKNYGLKNFTCVRADLRMERDKGYYIIQIYVPSILIVILSWVSFWLNVEAIPARISLGVLTILTLTTQSSSLQNSLPRVSYAKALDVWMAVCLVFVFAALLEFAFVNVLSRHSKSTDDVSSPTSSRKPSVNGTLKSIGKRKALLLDKVSRFGFPLMFGLINVIYWTYYTLM